MKPPSAADTEGRRVRIHGIVQGVGFRPYVYRLATSLGLVGSVTNTPAGVTVDVFGEPARLDPFLARLPRDAPARAQIDRIEVEPLDRAHPALRGFRVRASDRSPRPDQVAQADAVTCADCLRDVHDRAGRRFRYPFTTCAQCGPRFTIIETLPYDRARTTMRRFPLCGPCRAEYDDPQDRRFHAEGIACVACGPRLEAHTAGQEAAQAVGEAALAEAADVLRRGGLLALKGLGGWQLLCAADDAAAVARLRELKGRPHKPLAVMAPDLAAVRSEARVGAVEEQALTSPEGPVVLLVRARPPQAVTEQVAPGLDLVGVMLPTTPLHHLLLRDVGRWLVVTSANLEGEPIVVDDRQAREQFSARVDLCLGHDRPIAQRADDSIVRVAAGEPLLLRRARGWAARPVRLRRPLPPCVGVGGHLKATAGLAAGAEVLFSPHLGDLEGPAARAAHEAVVRAFLARAPSAPIACDLHPDYASTRLAERLGRPVIRVQHHEAHALSAWAEVGEGGSALAVTWDGSGWGTDGTVWGGEAFLLRQPRITRFARLKPFRLPGGEQAVREPRRAAFGLLHALGGAALIDARASLPCLSSFTPTEGVVLEQMLERDVNAPWTSSVGRLFDAVAALLDLSRCTSYEGQAALRLERAAGPRTAEAYPLPLSDPPPGVAAELDWAPLVRALLADLDAGSPVARIAATFHAGLADGVVALARRAGEERVLLSGGCFQNARLLEETRDRLTASGFRVAWPRALPPNDGGLALGQVVAAAWAQERASCA